MKPGIPDICVLPTATLETVLKNLQFNPHGICLVVDESSRVLGTITDGDCRRALLRGVSLQDAAKDVMHTDFIMVDASFSLPQIQFLMQTNGVEQIPIVDAERHVVDIVSQASLRAHDAVRSNSVVILAGGKGRRLHPLTYDVPKPMLPVAGKPMLEHLVARLTEYGFTNLYISVNYLGNVVEEHFQDGSQFGCQIRYLRETQELGTAGPLSLLPSTINEPLLVVNGDLVTAVNFASCIEFHQRHGFDFTIGMTNHTVEIPFGVIYSDDTGRVQRVTEKPVESYTVSAGIYVIEPKMLSLVPRDREFPMTDFIQILIDQGARVGAFPIHEKWLDVGVPESYQRAQKAVTGS